LTDSANLIARQIVTYPLVVCGSPAYFDQHERPEAPEHWRHALNFAIEQLDDFIPGSL